MPIPVDCSCGRHFLIKDDLAGKKVRCSECKGIMTVPQPNIETSPDDQPMSPPPASVPPFRKTKAPQLPEQYAPSRNRMVDDSAATIERKKKKPTSRKRKNSEGWFPAVSVNPSIVTGILMMLGAVVWFGVGLVGGVIFFYPPILFILGIGAVIKGFTGGD